MKAQIINKDGKPEWAVLPFRDYRKMMEALEDLADAKAIDAAMQALEAGEEETVPAKVTHRILDGESPLRVWRKHRGLTLHDLAQRCEVTDAAVSQIENRKRQPSVDLLKRLAKSLAVDVDDLLPD